MAVTLAKTSSMHVDMTPTSATSWTWTPEINPGVSYEMRASATGCDVREVAYVQEPNGIAPRPGEWVSVADMDAGRLWIGTQYYNDYC